MFGGGGFIGNIGNVVRDVVNRGGGVADQVRNVGERAVQGDIKGVADAAIGGATEMGRIALDPLGFTNPLFGDRKAPDAPGADQDLEAIKKAQKEQAKQFRAGLPQMQKQLGERIAQANNEQLSGALKDVDRSTNARGLLYGGINQGARGAERADASKRTAEARLSINKQLVDQANQMESAAISTGLQVQQSQQAIQDQIYNQALTNMMQRNQMFGSVLGAAGMAGGMAAARG